MSTATKDYAMVIGGEWAESESGARFEAPSPATGELLGTLPAGNARGRAAGDRGCERLVAGLGGALGVRAGRRDGAGRGL